jgi:23S rRNA pseudouridine1911/1915/1917 synthase
MRLSRDDENYGDSVSIETQRTILRQYARDNGLHVIDEYIDDGWSGTNFDRPDFRRMMDDMETGMINCIDKDTSGLLIVAKNDFAHQALADQLKDHSLSRVYECITVGGIREDSGTIDAPIGRHPTDRKKMAVTEKNSRPAVTHWQVLERFPGYTRVECRLETGRTHQIRVHLSWRNHPIVGDSVYGRSKPELGLDSQCLHARELTFVHPRTGQPVTVTCPLPDYFTKALEILRKR